MFKDSDKDTRTIGNSCSNLTIKTLENFQRFFKFVTLNKFRTFSEQIQQVFFMLALFLLAEILCNTYLRGNQDLSCNNI